MTPFNGTLECPFCTLVDDGQSPVWNYLFPHSPANEILLSTEHFIVILDTAPLVRGHLLLATKQHITSMASSPMEARHELLELKEEVESRLESAYGPVTVFEHGALTFARHAGACIDHAHLHILPGTFHLLPDVSRDYPEVQMFPDYQRALERLSKHPYLLFGSDTTGLHGVAAPACATQYLRKLVAHAAGSSHRWNWRDCIRWADILGIRNELIDAVSRLRI